MTKLSKDDYESVPNYSIDLSRKEDERGLLSSPPDSAYDEEHALQFMDDEENKSDHRIPHRHANENHWKGHIEEHFSRPELVRDCILGLSDGLTVPFALAAGLSSLGDSRIVIYGGLAELVSGAISMGLGGYLAARSEADHYVTEREREAREVDLYPEEEEEEIVELFEPYGLDRASMEPMLVKFRENTEKFIDFMMRFELNLEMPDPNRSWISAVTIGVSYLLGGFIPLLPYMFIADTINALWASIFVTSLTLFIFGYVKSIYLRPAQALIGALQTLAIGAIAAACSYGIVALVNTNTPQEGA
ncbi:VIT family-domain-containing protein [Radiomyces spectabilis]|uniref:VIT family-domain-containing protein n=1 Tax=Radiomyces spectabilis TaxID=64574 RepID=UPI00221EF00F|nr:VIT family-domain-containing protein [Radiomyces spectabilis]KAI8381184.1 VIT family-domain-containing protein [Radiomyces spectabilis]